MYLGLIIITGERQLVFASFFFWKPGSKKQKSLAGLTRSLLHDVLQACPDMIQKVLPNYWDQSQGDTLAGAIQATTIRQRYSGGVLTINI